MNTLRYFYQPILQTFDYRGRATRAQYWSCFGLTLLWYAFGAQFFLSEVLNKIPNSLLSLQLSTGYDPTFNKIVSIATNVLVIAAYLLPYLPLVSMTARRMRDANAPAWLFGSFAVGNILFLIALVIAATDFSLYFWAMLTGLPGILIMAVSGIGCMVTGLKPSIDAQPATVTTQPAPASPTQGSL